MRRDEVVAVLRAAGCVWAEDEAELLLACTPGSVPELVARRAGGEPLEQVVGWADFAGLRVVVAPGVFVPRRRSELLVTVAEGLPRVDRPVLVDVGCGTGALGVAVLARLGGRADLHVTDVDPAAVACSRANLPPGASAYCGDLLDPLPASLRGRVDVLLANAPYVPTDEIAFLPAEAREYEHRVALDGGADGLDVHRRIASAAFSWLRPGGTLLIEVSDRQRAPASALLTDAGLDVAEHTDADLGALVLSATRPPTPVLAS